MIKPYEVAGVHILVSWDITNASEPGAWNMWNERLKEVIKSYSWVRPLNTVYVIEVPNEFVRRNIINGLQAVSRQHSGYIHIVVTPAMVGGQYDGVLPQNLWPELNARSS
ncbi:hypothetical protein A8L48_22570 [Rhizobium rhizogenes]|nr:hypothetical protein B0909_05555 [Rhizobium rhizogenes]OAM65782.1 hypothetical protein A8L48_22570 [Rhizobium rhizogenes]